MSRSTTRLAPTIAFIVAATATPVRAQQPSSDATRQHYRVAARIPVRNTADHFDGALELLEDARLTPDDQAKTLGQLAAVRSAIAWH